MTSSNLRLMVVLLGLSAINTSVLAHHSQPPFQALQIQLMQFTVMLLTSGKPVFLISLAIFT